MTIFAENIINMQNTMFQMKNVNISDIQTLVIRSSSESSLIIQDCFIEKIGNHIVYHLEDIENNHYLEKFRDIMVSNT